MLITRIKGTCNNPSLPKYNGGDDVNPGGIIPPTPNYNDDDDW